MNSVWEALLAYKNSPAYTKRVVAAFAHRATLRSRWSAL